jgi:hypothetical protein
MMEGAVDVRRDALRGSCRRKRNRTPFTRRCVSSNIGVRKQSFVIVIMAIARICAIHEQRVSSMPSGSNNARYLGLPADTLLIKLNAISMWLYSRQLQLLGIIITSSSAHVPYFGPGANPLIPVLQHAVQITRYDLTRLPRMPLHCQHRCVTRLKLVPHLARLPVPEEDLTTTASRADDLTIRADSDIW